MNIKLQHPLNFGKASITDLTFRDYTTAEDYLSFDQRGGVAQRIALIASLTGTDEALVKQLRGPDYIRAERMASDMMLADEISADDGDIDRVKYLAKVTGFSPDKITQVLNLAVPSIEIDSSEDELQKKSFES